MMQRCVESGLLIHFKRKSQQLIDSRNVVVDSNSAEQPPEMSTTTTAAAIVVETIKFADLYLGFVLYGMGILLSTSVFAFEIFIYEALKRFVNASTKTI